MARYSNVQSNFSGGLVTDYVVNRLDIERLKNSGRQYENFLPTIQGPTEYRPGTEHKYREAGTTYIGSVSASITFASNISYRCVFGSREVKIFDNKGALVDTVGTPYSAGELKDLKFSSETNELYVTHPSHRPRLLTGEDGFEFTGFNLQDSAGLNLLTNDDPRLQLTVNAGVVQGGGDWSLTEVDFKVEPFLEEDTSDIKMKLTKGQEIAKLESSDAGLQTIIDAATPTDFYVEYSINGKRVLGKVLDSSSSTNYSEVADPSVSGGLYTLYVDAVDFITDISEPNAKLHLLDNAETTNGSIQETQLIQEGVPDGDVHIRSDVDIFDNSNVGTWLRVGDDRRSSDVLLGEDSKFNLTRWVKITDYLALESHPVDFYRGAKYQEQNNNSPLNHDYTVYESGGVYKAYGNSNLEIQNYDNTRTGEVAPNNGNRVFSWTGGKFAGSHHTVGDNPIVGNLSTAKSFEVLKCDSSLTVQEYDASINSTGKLVTTTAVNTIATEIANDVTITATGAFFDTTKDVDRHIRLEFPSGMVYAKILQLTSNVSARARLNTVVPRNQATGGYESDGVATGFSMGAWFVNNYPRAVAKYEQRRFYGGTQTHPNLVFVSRLNNEQDFSPTQEDKIVLDTDGFTYALSNINAAIFWIKSAKDLIVGTSRGVFKLVVNQFQASVSPKTVRFEFVSEVGCEKDGVLAGTSFFFPDESNTELLEYKYESETGLNATEDVSKLIYPNLVKDTIVKVEFQNNPQPRIWVVVSSGKLYCLTYNLQENYYAWSKHDIENGVVTDVTVLRRGFDSGLDQVWLTVQRGFNDFRYELLFSENDDDDEKTHYLDGAIKQVVDVAANISPGGTLVVDADTALYPNGSTVSVVFRGRYYGDFTVTPGGTISFAISERIGTFELVYGRRYTGIVELMYPTWDGQNKPAFGAETIRVVSQKVHLINSTSFKQGIDGQHQEIKLPGFDNGITTFTGFDKERPLVNSQFGVEKVPELVQDKPYKTVFGSVVTKTDLN